MAYSGKTLAYKIPFQVDGDTMEGEVESFISRIIDNQLRMGSLFGPVVAAEGTYDTVVETDGSTNVILGGNPAVRGTVNKAFLEANGILTWQTTLPGISHLYIQGTDSIFSDPSAITTIVSSTQILRDDHLYMAQLDRTTPTSPILNISPPDKPTLLNLSLLLSTPINPFGLSLRQDNMTIADSLTVLLNVDKRFLLTTVGGSNQPALQITNTGDKASLFGTIELSFGDSRQEKIVLTDTNNFNLPDQAISIVDAITRASRNTEAAADVIGGTFDDGTDIFTNSDHGNTFDFPLTGSRTLRAPTNPTGGQRIVWRFTQDSVGSRILTLDPVFNAGPFAPVVLSTTADSIDYMEALYDVVRDKWDIIRVEKDY